MFWIAIHRESRVTVNHLRHRDSIILFYLILLIYGTLQLFKFRSLLRFKLLPDYLALSTLLILEYILCMYGTLFLNLCQHLLFYLFDFLFTLVFLAGDYFLNKLRILLLLSHLGIVDYLLLLLKLLFQNLGSRSVCSRLQILLRFLWLLLLLI